MPNVLSVLPTLHCIVMFKCCINMVKGSNFHECKSIIIIHLRYSFKIKFQQIKTSLSEEIQSYFCYEISHANQEGGPPT